METKSQPQRKLLKRRRTLQADELAPSNNARKPVSALVASAKLPDRKIRQLIRCYAEGKTPKEAMETCGLSHVTVRRTYRQIRERLIDVALYQPQIAPGAPASWQKQSRPLLVKLMREEVRPHRGVRDENIDPYYAEAVYRRENETAPGQLYGLILKAIADLGPLNRKPQLKFANAHFTERFRQMMGNIRVEVRSSEDSPATKAKLHSLIDGFEHSQLEAADKIRQTQREP